MTKDTNPEWDDESLSDYRDILHAMERDRDHLSEEPAPFFFARQRQVIRDRIEARAEGWFARLFPVGRLWQARPVRGFALVLALFVSWTVFRTGHLPFMGADLSSETASVIGEALLSDDTLSLVLESFESEGELPFLL